VALSNAPEKQKGHKEGGRRDIGRKKRKEIKSKN